MKSEKKPLVSVIMLTYNHEKYIAQALDSVLMQKTDFDYEVLIGDDASTDGTVNILKSYQSRFSDRIHLFLNRENTGATRNAYRLLIRAKGQYLASCEGDDYWTDPEKLSIQVKFLQAHPELVGCAHYCDIVDEKGIKWKKQKLSWIHYKKRFTIHDFQGLFMPGQPNTYVRKNIISQLNDLPVFYQLHPQIGDRTLMLLFLLKGDFGLIPKSMSAYRKKRNGSLSVTGLSYQNKAEGWKNDYNLINAYENICKKEGCPHSFSKGKGRLLAKAFCWYLLNRDRECLCLMKTILNAAPCKIRMLWEAGNNMPEFIYSFLQKL